MNLKEYALVVAGGKGTRIKSNLPKQFLELLGLPVLMHTINAFFSYNPAITIILVLPEDDFDLWKELCKKHHFDKPLILQKGGASRFQSVKNGLQHITDSGLVAIHDGVRPLISTDVIASSFQFAGVHRSAVAAVSMKESIRLVEGEQTKAVDRSRFKLIQTPQTFDVTLIQNAYETEELAEFTDDASVAEQAGHTVFLFQGSYENIKITTAEDLVVAEALLKIHDRDS
jgi:2-C-methyl-D-erythritol 4-phosphate cytidylyltransferase